ncbi:hypothetical protein SUGI_1133400 [Cryptomeria japonica]|nr:hypothetical protein SUGI_1133400 [Cryptomeria japonica]
MAVYDQSPSIDELAEGIAAHLLNRNTKTPITVGIAGECGSDRRESTPLLLTAAQAAFPLEDFNGKKDTELSEKSERIEEGVDFPHNDINGGQPLRDEDKRKQLSKKGARIKDGVANLLVKQNPEQIKEKALINFLEEYQPNQEAVYKYLACLELNQLVKDKEHESKEKSPVILRVLTVNFSCRDLQKNFTWITV